MQLNELKNKLLFRLGVTSQGVTPTTDPQAIRRQQISKILICVSVVLFTGFYLFSSMGTDSNKDSSDQNTQNKLSPEKSKEKSALDMATPLKSLDERAVWVASVERKANEMKEDNNRVKEENQFLQKRVDVIEQFLDSYKTGAINGNQPEIQRQSMDDIKNGNIPSSTLKPQNQFPSPPVSQGQPQRYPPMGSDLYKSQERNSNYQDQFEQNGNSAPMRKSGPKIAFLGGGNMGGGGYKNAAMYVPAGSHSKAVIMSGVAASTATAAQSNPQPMLLRLVDEGNLPRGFKSRVKDAVLTGACYGDISSERVLCRLETMSWVEKDGSIAEKRVEGWVYGEDGRAGLRGEVVDRAGGVVRESFGAGILSAISNFIKFEATSSVYPVSPFGVTNAMSGKDVAQGAITSGAGNAFDKLAEFSIKRAEQMQPVIMVSAGRVVDVVFKSGFDLLTDTGGEMKVVGANNNTQYSNNSVEG